MKKIFTILITLLPLLSLSQFSVSGIVYSKSDNLGVPGAQIVEKGTTNGTIANLKGEFELKVSNQNAILIVSSVGFQQKELKINGQSIVSIQIKEDCNIDWFDLNKIGIDVLSGLINTPIGGQFYFSFPFVRLLPVIKAQVSYQSDFKNNNFFNGNIGFYHLFQSCDFDSDINFNFKNIKLNQNFDLSSSKITTNLNFNKFGLIIGLGNIRNRKDQTNLYRPILGFSTEDTRPLWLNIDAKFTLNRQFIETDIDIKRDFKFFKTFTRFYSINGFKELTLGIGKEIYYK